MIKVADRFGKKVAKYAIKNNVDAVIVYDTTASTCFEILSQKAPKIIRIIDHAQAPRNYLYYLYQQDKDKCGVFWETLKNAKYLNNESNNLTVQHEIDLAQYHIVASTFSKKALLFSGVNEEKIFTVPYGVSLDKFIPSEKNNDEKLSLLFVGEVNQRKGIYQILEAAKKIHNPNIEFHVVGYGIQFNEELYKEYEDCVIFHGPMFSTDLQMIYSSCDVFLFPVMGEGFGLVVLEALSAGLPVICSRNCVGSDVIVDGINGFLIDSCDTEALQQKILWFYNNRNQLPQYRVNARETALKFTWDRYYENIGKQLMKLCKEKHEIKWLKEAKAVRQIESMKELKDIELSILEDVDRFCIEHNINYFVSYGTMIGAIRHKGFIPWDDDVDIAMPRNDYKKFVRYYTSDRYEVLSNEKQDYYYNFAKVVDTRTYARELNLPQEIKQLGVYIDVFPLDGISDNPKRAKWHYQVAHFLNRFVRYSKSKDNSSYQGIANYVLWKISRFYGFKRAKAIFDSWMNKCNSNNSSAVFSVNSPYGMREIIQKNDISKVIRMPYETIEVNVPQGYDSILTSIYGDYMTPPPETQRVRKHNTTYWWRE